MVKARFEDQIKDISYIIQLFNYIIENNINNDIKLYIIDMDHQRYYIKPN